MNIAVRNPRKLNVETFLAFYDTRPDEEQWQLVDGVALLMTPPFPRHQRIASNLERLLNDALETQAPHLGAYQRVGVELSEFPHYRPEPDVIVSDLHIPPDQRHVDRFYLVAEVISSSDEDRVALQREFYRSHGENLAIMLIRQDRHELELDARTPEGWRTVVLQGTAAKLDLSAFGVACSLGDIYRNTFLRVE